MKKTDLVAQVAAKAGLDTKTADAAVAAVFDVIKDALIAEDKVQLIGFGTFETKVRAAHQGRNPSTGAVIDIPETKTPVFKAGKTLRESVK